MHHNAQFIGAKLAFDGGIAFALFDAPVLWRTSLLLRLMRLLGPQQPRLGPPSSGRACAIPRPNHDKQSLRAILPIDL